MKITKEILASYIDHTILKPNATPEDVKRLCEEAKKYGFHSVCVNPYFVPLAKKELEGTGIKVVSVVGFPLGSTFKEVKFEEAKRLCDAGVDEIDMVMNLAAFKSGDYDYVKEEIRGVVEISKPRTVKVIIETCYLSQEEKIKAAKIVMEAGAHFVKTSTGFGPEGAKVEDIRLLKSIVGDKIGIKASGGIRDAKKAIQMIEAGATRIGASHGVEIVESLEDLE